MDSYALSYLLKGIGDIPVGQAETAMLVLAIKHGYVLPEALLEVHRNNHYQTKIQFMLHIQCGNTKHG